MSNFNIRIRGTANMTQARAEFAKLEAQVAALNKSMEDTVLVKDKMGNPVPWTTNVKGIREARTALKTYSATYRDAAASTGMFEVSQLRVNSATEEYTKALDKQKVSFSQWLKQRKLASAAFREQLALQQMVVKQMPGRTAGGKQMFDVAIPSEVHQDLKTFSKELGWAGIQLKSFSTQMVNWGKNTQWAGRQLMVGFTVPVIAFGAAAGASAYKVNAAMTRIQKVYNTTANATSGNLLQMAAAQQELDSVRNDSMATAVKAAKAYGASINDTLDVTAQMAAVGYKGAQLQEMTTQVMRASTLGEIDNATAMKSTIAMMTVFHHSTKQMANDWNYMNSVENATSLEMKDFAAAIPIAAKPVEMMGGTIKDLGTMLVAMKAGGIEATQGANAIKSALQRLLNPSKEALDLFQSITHVDFTALQQQTKGNLLEMLKAIGAATEHLSALQRGQVLGKLFGTYQVTRLTTLMDGLNGVGKSATQVASAMRIANQSTEQWGKTADYELGRIQQSAAGKFKIAIETLKAELASVGEPFLQAGTDILHVIVKIMHAFANLPDSVKKGMAWGSILMATVGPLVMLIGLSANFAGNIMSVFASMMKLLGSMELVNKESAVSRLAMQLQKNGFVNTGTAVEKLRQQLEMLAIAQNEAARAAGTLPGYFAGSSMFSGPYKGPAQPRSAGGQFTRARPYMMPVQDVNGRPAGAMLSGPNSIRNPKGRIYTPVVPNDIPLNNMALSTTPNQRQMMIRNSDAQTLEREEQSTRKMSANMRGVALSGGVFAGAMAASMISSNKTVDSMANIAMSAAIIGPGLVGAAKALQGIELAGMVSKFGAMSTAVTGMFSGTISWLRAFKQAPSITGHLVDGLKGAVGTTGMLTLGIVAVGAALYEIHKKANEASDAIKNMNSNAEGMGKIFGYTPTDQATVVGGNKANSPAAQANAVIEMKNTYPELIQRIKDAHTEQDKLNEALRAGLLVLDSGGSAQQARQATVTALKAAEGVSKGTKIAIHFKAQLDFNKADIVAQAAKAVSQIDVAQAVQATKSKGFWETLNDSLFNFHPFWDKQSNVDNILPKQAEAWAEDAGKKAKQAYLNGLNSPTHDGADKIFTMVKDNLNEIDKQIAASTGSEKVRLQELRKAYIVQVATQTGANASIKNLSDSWFQGAHALDVLEKTTVGANLTDKQRYNLLHQQYEQSGLNAMQMGQMLALYDKLNGKTKTNANDMNAAAAATGKAAKSMYDLNKEMKAYQGTDWVSSYKDAMSATEQQLGDIASQNFQNKMDTAMQAYTDQQDKRLNTLKWQQKAETDAFNKRWRDRTQKVNDYYNQRVKNIKSEMAAEQKAEQQRQAMFDAEIQRMQRLADMQNQNIDFNTALNSGSLDEAAKIMNDMTAKETEWALGKAQDAAKKASDQRQAELQHEEDALNKSKQQRLNHLKDIETAEKRALEKRQQREQAALQKEIDMNVKAQQEIWDNRKAKLDQAIQYFEDYIPRNEADLRRHIADVSNAYSDFNVKTQGQFHKTAVNIGKMLNANVRDAGQKIRSDVQWAGVGKDVAQKMIQGAFGMNLHQFKNWLITGKWPNGSSGGGHMHGPMPSHPHNKAGVRTDHTNAPSQFSGDPTYYAYEQKLEQQMNTFHTGGIVGVDRGGRAGIPKGHPDEVPATLLKGEGVLNRKAMANIGPTGFRALNKGVGNDAEYGTGGYSGGPLGFAGLMGALMFRAVAQTIGNAAIDGAVSRMTGKAASGAFVYTPGSHYSAGAAHAVGLSPVQMQNATLIANVGSQMGMTKRDIEIAIMTAMTESSLSNLNYGDRDSLGLFQQRPSQGWGTPAQIENPRYAAHKFYEALRGVGDRGNMAPWLAAQAVQRSAYADGSNYRQYWNEAMAIYSSLGRGRPVIGGDRGWHRPVASKYPLTQGLHDQYTGFPAVDFGVPVGTPVVSAAPGRVVKSYDLRGFEPRNAIQNGYRSYGRVIQVSHPGGFQSLYAHLSNREAHVGQSVMGGQELGRSGNTGYSTGPHLHFGTQGISPMKFVSLNKGAQDIRWDNTVANLHHGEAVLTKDINDEFKRGVKNFADGGHTEYNLHMHVNENVNVDELVGKTMTAIRRLEMRKPQSRRN